MYFIYLLTITSACPAFDDCIGKIAQKSADCSAGVSDTPTLEYWQCLCDADTSRNQCYYLCNDEDLILQAKQIEAQGTIGSCAYVQQQRSILATKPKTTLQIAKPTTSTKKIGNSTVTVVRPSIPPLKQNNFSGTASVDMNQGNPNFVSSFLSFILAPFAFLLI